MASESVIGVSGRLASAPGAVLPPVVSTQPEIAAHQQERAFVRLFREAWSITATYPMPVLGAAFIGFAGAAIIGNLLFTALVVDVYQRTGSYFSSTANIFYAQLELQAFLGVLLILQTPAGRGHERRQSKKAFRVLQVLIAAQHFAPRSIFLAQD